MINDEKENNGLIDCRYFDLFQIYTDLHNIETVVHNLEYIECCIKKYPKKTASETGKIISFGPSTELSLTYQEKDLRY